MLKYNNKWADRRTAKGILKPTLFLIFEIIFYVLVMVMVNAFNIPLLTILTGFVVLYFLATSTIVRYIRACGRQKYNK
ncbi:MAG: hypothetical protein U9Q90_03560 [Campylobacterota bacterium]|nr:hypothetical protein [Campylobacterota bacterium]